MMIFNVGDLRKLIQDLDDDTIIQIDDGIVYSCIDDAVVLHNKRSDRRKVLSLHTQILKVTTPVNLLKEVHNREEGSNE